MKESPQNTGKPKSALSVTVIVCTYNRCDSLGKTLEDVSRSTLPAEIEWEVLVVDNNSKDGTREVVETLGRKHPGRFRYLFEPHPGKSYALNAGVADAKGDIIAFMDDDVAVGPEWLRNLIEPLQLNGTWAGVGGRVVLDWACSPPPWLAVAGPYNLAGLLAQFDLGEAAKELDRAPIGANMAVRKEMFEKYGGYRLDLGPSPNAEIPRPNEDTEFGRRLMAAGERFLYEPAAVAHHGVPEERLKREYFLTWWYDYGRAAAREMGARPDVLGFSRHNFTILKIIASSLSIRSLRWIFAVDPQSRFFWKCFAWKNIGEIFEIRRLPRGPVSKPSSVKSNPTPNRAKKSAMSASDIHSH